MADKASYFSRFTVKLIEMVAAGLATAISGYLVAHLGGYFFSAPQAPSALPGTPAAQQSVPAGSPASATAAVTAPTAKVTRPPREGDVAAKPAGTATASRKHAPTGAVENKVREQDSVEAQVRAALANVNAKEPAAVVTPTAPIDTPPHTAALPPPAHAAAAPPRPAEEALTTGAVASPMPATIVTTAPTATAVASVPPATAEQAPMPLEPPPAVEIKSRPVAAVEASPPQSEHATHQSAQDDAQANAQDSKDIFSVIKKIPHMLRPDPPAPTQDAPRPPLAVGE